LTQNQIRIDSIPDWQIFPGLKIKVTFDSEVTHKYLIGKKLFYVGTLPTFEQTNIKKGLLLFL
jgi:hypothetical protein